MAPFGARVSGPTDLSLGPGRPPSCPPGLLRAAWWPMAARRLLAGGLLCSLACHGMDQWAVPARSLTGVRPHSQCLPLPASGSRSGSWSLTRDTVPGLPSGYTTGVSTSESALALPSHPRMDRWPRHLLMGCPTPAGQHGLWAGPPFSLEAGLPEAALERSTKHQASVSGWKVCGGCF